MTPNQFKERFTSHFPSAPQELGVEFGPPEFVLFPLDKVQRLGLPTREMAFLTQSGLPADAPPGLNFFEHPEVLQPLAAFPDSVRLGANSFGDDVCIDLADEGSVIYYNHDRNMERVFINSSLAAFALSLVTFLAALSDRCRESFRDKMVTLDRKALEPGAFWDSELKAL